MTDILNSPTGWQIENAAEAGRTAAVLADSFYDTAQTGSWEEGMSGFGVFSKITADLIGEGSIGEKALIAKHLGYASIEDIDPPASAVVLNNAGDLTAYDLGLRPRVNRQQVAEIKARVEEAASVMANHPPQTKEWRRPSPWNYDVVKNGADLVVAYASQSPVPLKRDRFSVLDDYVNPCDEGVEEYFMVTIDGRQYDIRSGMTRNIYQALQTRYKGSMDTYHHPRQHATVITGERTPRNGYWLTNKAGGFRPVNPQRIQGHVPLETSELLMVGYRPAVVLEGLLGDQVA